MSKDFDYIIIGSGPAGRKAAENLAKAKKKVCLVEKGSFGGAEINTRDLPYKIALDFADTYRKFMTSSATSGGSSHFNLPTLSAEIDTATEKTSEKLKNELQKTGVKILSGFAHFLDSNTIAVDDKKYTASNFILATGSKIKVNEIAGLDSVGVITPSNVFKIRRLPRYVFIVGGGSTGVEIAEFFANLGVGVIIMERGSHLLPREDEEVGNYITEKFTKNLGITVITSAKVLQITEDRMSKIVVFMSNTGEKMVRVDSIVLATGSEPFLDYSLENAGVEYKRSGIITDKYFNTTAKNIFAIGDCIGGDDSSTERAIYEADILTENLLHRGKTPSKYQNLIRSIDTHPQIATLGYNERDAISHDLGYKKSLVNLENPNDFIKILTDRSGKLIGTTIITKNAKEALKAHKLLTK